VSDIKAAMSSCMTNVCKNRHYDDDIWWGCGAES